MHAPEPPMSISMFIFMELFIVAVAEGIMLLTLLIPEAMVIVPIVLMAAALDWISIILQENLRRRRAKFKWSQKFAHKPPACVRGSE